MAPPPLPDQERLRAILAFDLQPRIDWAYALEQLVAGLGAGFVTAGNGDPNGLITKPEGYLFLDLTTPAVWQNQDGATLWTQLGSGGAGGAVDSVDGRTGVVTLNDLYDADGAAVTAFNAATAYADSLAGDYDPAGSAATAQAASQPVDADLTTIAGLTATTDNVIQSVGSAWASRTPAQLKATLALTKGDVGLGNVDNTADASKAFSGAQITSGTVADGRIDATIARDSEVTSAISALSSVYQPLDSDLTAIAALTTTSYGRALLELANAAAALTALGLDADLGTFALPASTTISTFGASLVDDAAASDARTTLGLGTAAVAATGDFDAAGAAAAAQSASQPLDSDLTAIAALSTTSFGRGLLILADAAALLAAAGAQAADADLTTIAGLTATTDNMIQSVGSAWASRTPAQVRTALGLVIGTNVQAFDADLTTYAGITPGALGQAILPMTTLTNHGVVIGQAGSAPVATTAGTTDYPLVSNGASADPAFEQLNLAAAVQGILAIANGGTGRATQQDGWNADTVTWTYASATSFTIAGVDATSYLAKGTRVSYNDGSVDYGVVASVVFSTDTTVTLIPNADYSIANAALSAPRYSFAATPVGFPTWFNWTPTLSGWSVDPTNAVYRFTTTGKSILISIRQATAGTSNAAGHTATLPVAAVTITNMVWSCLCRAQDFSVNGTGTVSIASAGTVANLHGIAATATSSATGSSQIYSAQLTYEF